MPASEMLGSKQRIGPDQNAGAHAGDGAEGAVPRRQNSPPKKAGANCATAAKDNSPIDGKLRFARRAVIDVGEQQDDEDGDAPRCQKLRAGVAGLLRFAGVERGAALEHQRHHDVVRHHDGERDRFHDHHRGRRRQAADEGDQRDQFGMRGQRQRHDEHVAVDMASRKRQKAGHRDRQHEQIDQHQIDREQPGGAADFGFAVVLDHRDVELPRQQNDGEQRQRRHGGERRELRRRGQHGGGMRLLDRACEQIERAVEHDEGDENADGGEGHELDDQFRRDRQHQAVLMLGGVDVAGAEQNGEGRHGQRDEQRDVAEQRRTAGAACARMVETEADTALSCSAI